MSGPDISCDMTYGGEHCAIDRNLYDGAPDAGRQYMGWGKTREEAITELASELLEAGAYTQEELSEAINE